MEYGEVAAACEEMLDRSDFPISNRKVRNHIGRGSMTDIQMHLKKWLSENNDRIEEKIAAKKIFTLDEEVINVLTNSLNSKINAETSNIKREILEWKKAYEDIQDEYENIKSNKELVEKTYKQEIEEKNTTIGELNCQIRALKYDNDGLKNKIDNLTTRHEQFIKDIQSRDTEIKRLKDDNKKASDDIVRNIELLSATKQAKESTEILYNEIKKRLSELEQRTNIAESGLLEFKLEAEKNINIVKETMRSEWETKLGKLADDHRLEIDNLINSYEKKIEKINNDYRSEIARVKNEAINEKQSLMQVLNNLKKN